MGMSDQELFTFIKERKRRLEEQRLYPLTPVGATPEKFIALRKQLCCSASRLGELLNPRVSYWTIRDWEDGLQPIPHSVIVNLLKLNTLFASEAAKIISRVQREKLTELTFYYYFFDEDFRSSKPEDYHIFRGNCDLYYAFRLYLEKALKTLDCHLVAVLDRSPNNQRTSIATKISQAWNEDISAFSDEILHTYREEYYKNHGYYPRETPLLEKNNAFQAYLSKKRFAETPLMWTVREPPPPIPEGYFFCRRQKRRKILLNFINTVPGCKWFVLLVLGIKQQMTEATTSFLQLF